MKNKTCSTGACLSVILALSSCHDHGVHIRVNDDTDEYRLRASFDEDPTDDVQRVINRHLPRIKPDRQRTSYTDCDFGWATEPIST